MPRLVVISDLHIGGSDHPMLGHPQVLTSFLKQLADHRRSANTELVVAGDFVDFLAEQPSEPWTPSEAGAVSKLECVFSKNATLFDAFARCAQALPRFTLLLGNHDIELAYPLVRKSLFRRLGTDQHRCHFIQDNEAYRVGDVLIEHGNRYDSWNAIDHNGLRQIVSCASRGESASRSLDICPGSQLVYSAMNPLKERYHFIDLLKPEGKILALLLLEFEPTIVKTQLPELFRFASLWISERFRKAQWHVGGDGISPTNERLVAVETDNDIPNDIRREFYAELYEIEARQEHNASANDALKMVKTIILGKEKDGLKAIFARGEAISPARMRKLQAALRGVLDADETFDEALPDGNCYAAAKKIVAAGTAKVVVMGHTHLARDIDLPNGGRYINTGTWADIMQVDRGCLVDSDQARVQLCEWLRKLAEDRLDGIREHSPRYADIELGEDGCVQAASLRTFGPATPLV